MVEVGIESPTSCSGVRDSITRLPRLTGCCLLLNESSAESCMNFLHYFHAAIKQPPVVKVKNMF